MKPVDIRELASDIDALRPDYAASQINAIADEFERLTAELDRPTALEAALKVELDSANAEIERLRAELEKALSDLSGYKAAAESLQNDVYSMLDAARGE